MFGYIFVLVWIGGFAILAKPLQFKRTKIVNEVEIERFIPIIALLVFFPVMYMAATRSFGFTDSYGYYLKFESMPSSFDDLRDYLSGQKKDTGFYLLSSLIKIIISKDPRVYFWILAVIHSIILIWFFNNFSNSYITSVFLFVASTDYISWMFNGIRQFTAVVIVLLATPFILKRKYLVAVLFVLLASTMHQSALIVLPVLIIARGDAWNKRTLIFTVLVLLAVVFVDQFTDILNDSLSGTQYKNVVSDYTSINDNGTNILRVFVYSVPAFASLFFRKQINEKGNILIKLCANVSIVSAGLYWISMATSGVFLGRLPIYFSLYGYILIPWIISNLIKNDYKKYAYSIMVILYLILYYYQMSVRWNLF